MLGGVETYSEQVSLAYLRQGYSVSVITQFPGPPGWSTRGLLRVYNVGPGAQAVVAWKMYRETVRFLKSNDISFIHATTWRVALAAILARSKSALYTTVHGREVAMSRGLVSVLMKQVFAKVKMAIVISQTSLNYCSQLLPVLSRIGTISWNGITFPAEARMANAVDFGSDTLTLLTACRLVERKNVSSCIRAISQLNEGGMRNIRLMIAGTGDLESELKRLSVELNVDHMITFLGHVPQCDMPGLYEQAHVFLHPQKHSHDPRDFESFCLAVVDAMAFGLVTIAGCQGAPQEYIVDGRNGFLVQGMPQEIAEVLRKISENPCVSAEIATTAKEWALENLSWDRHITPIIDCEMQHL